jgi:adenosylcobinamide kinase/adenosylcobinamide-phosphate guanylyltransferase
MGLVPEQAGSRNFRDLAGLVNQKAAGLADSVVFMVSGQALRVR